jgi:hypothetical protein
MSDENPQEVPPAWPAVGDRVDYCSVIGGPPVRFNQIVRAGPQLVCGTWCVWLEGKIGCVAVKACRKTSTIPALWFDRDGCGPDHFGLHLKPVKPDMGGAIPAALGILVRAGDLVIKGGAMVDGGFYLHREEVAELHKQLGEWLKNNEST